MNDHDPDDSELMVACREGSVQAFERLVERHKDRLVNFFYGMCNDRALAEDLAQDVFVKLYRYRDRYEPSGKFTSYMFTIARNHWYDHLRKVKRRPDPVSLEQPVGGDEYAGTELKTLLSSESAEQPFQKLDDERRRTVLHDAVKQLPDGQRMVIVLSCFEQRPHEEIAEILDVPEGTVKSRKHLAIKKLKKWVHGEEEPPST